ncbi:MAG: superoxide dismutase family protein [Hyphomicrobiales bacterium]|nr:superoxide dismutase family protein [Hyphomicrobiales bacterium]
MVTVLMVCSHAVQAAQEAKAQMRDANGTDVGTVTLKTTPHGTLLSAQLTGMPEGTHAFHVHAVGQCEPPFKSAGGHFNPTGKEHGILNPAGPHAGDMPNIHVPASGALDIEVLVTDLALDDALFDDDGASIVIHQGADDYVTDPAGSAGPRIACGVIER